MDGPVVHAELDVLWRRGRADNASTPTRAFGRCKSNVGPPSHAHVIIVDTYVWSRGIRAPMSTSVDAECVGHLHVWLKIRRGCFFFLFFFFFFFWL